MKIKDIRRITVDPKSVKKALKWFWYYQCENDEWCEHELTNYIETSFKIYFDTKKFKETSLNASTKINFEKMILKNENSEQKLRRRPEFTDNIDNKHEKQ